MGNSPPTGGLLLGNGDHSYQANIRGSSARLMFSGREVQLFHVSWKMTYKVGMSTCDFVLRKELDIFASDERELLLIEISDDVHGTRSRESFDVAVETDGAGLLDHSYQSSMKLRIVNSLIGCATNAYGVTTETISDIYGSGTRRGLVVTEWKTKSKDRMPYMGTVTHYYVDDENGQDVGLSVAVKKIRSCNNKIEFDVDGPQEHPADALAFMFKQVLKTRTWKPTLCPHCASKYIDERLSESESDIDNVPTPPLYGRTQNAGSRSIVSNPGSFKGQNIGNTYINHYHRRK